MGFEIGGVEMGDRSGAALASFHVFPRFYSGVAKGRESSNTCHYYSFKFHYIVLLECFDKKFDFDLNFDGSMVRCPLKVNAKVKFQDFLAGGDYFTLASMYSMA